MVEGQRRAALLPLHHISKLLSDTILTWVNNVRAKQEYRSAITYFELWAGVICVQMNPTGELKCQNETRPVYTTQQQPSKALKLQILVVWFFVINWVQRFCCDLL